MTDLTPEQEEGIKKHLQERAELIKRVLAKYQKENKDEEYKAKLIEEEVKRINSNGKRK